MRTWKHDFLRYLLDPEEYYDYERGEWEEVRRFNALLRGAQAYHYGATMQDIYDAENRRREIRELKIAIAGPPPKSRAERLMRNRRRYKARVTARKNLQHNAAMINRLDAKGFWQAQAMAGAV